MTTVVFEKIVRNGSVSSKKKKAVRVTLRWLQMREGRGVRAAVRMTVGAFKLQTPPEEEEEKRFSYSKSVTIDADYFAQSQQVRFSAILFQPDRIKSEYFDYLDHEESDFTMVSAQEILRERKHYSLTIPLNNGEFNPRAEAESRISASFELCEVDARDDLDMLEGNQLLIGRHCLLREKVPLEYPPSEAVFKAMNLHGTFD